jgi:5-methylthioadenosine/S-adenosylhomocysteine deaminase
VQGARADGLDSKIGTLTPGKEADIVTLRTDLPNRL